MRAAWPSVIIVTVIILKYSNLENKEIYIAICTLIVSAGSPFKITLIIIIW